MKPIAYIIMIFACLSVSAQGNEDRARKLLSQVMELDGQYLLAFHEDNTLGTVVTVEFVHNVDTLINGIISQGLKTDSIVTYVKLRDVESPIRELHNFKVYGYSEESNILIIGRWEIDSMCSTKVESIYTYNPYRQVFIEQGTFEGGVHGIQVKGNSMYVRLDVKNHDGTGSRLLYVPFAIKTAN